MRRISVAQARRLALHAQGLAAPFPRRAAPLKDPAAVSAVVERIGCLQLDPVAPVARSPLLVLWARLGPFDEAALHAAAYERRELFEHWAHEASLCWIGDLPLYAWAMRKWFEGAQTWQKRWQPFLEGNAETADSVVAQLRERGPLRAREIEVSTDVHWTHGWWTDEVTPRQTFARLLDSLWWTGRLGITRREGQERIWDVLERCLPDGAWPPEQLSAAAVTRRAAVRAVRMLGVARVPHIRAHFTRDRYPQLEDTLDALARAGELERVAVEGLRGTWWAAPQDLEALPELPPGRRTTFLSPFDNVLCDRARTAELFDFEHRLEIYVPPQKRRWGYYVLPVLHGERFVARADLAIDRDAGVLRVLSFHRDVRWTKAIDTAVGRALERLAAWRGVDEIVA